MRVERSLDARLAAAAAAMLFAMALACGPAAAAAAVAVAPAPAAPPALLTPLSDAREGHLAGLLMLPHGGQNAEAYWSPDSRQLIFQSTRPPFECDQIFRMPADGSGAPALVSTGKGRTTCAYFMPDRRRSLARLRLGGLSDLRHLDGAAGRLGPAAPDGQSCLRRRDHGLQPRRLAALHLRPRRRPGPLPHGRGRQPRPAPDLHAGLRRRSEERRVGKECRSR